MFQVQLIQTRLPWFDVGHCHPTTLQERVLVDCAFPDCWLVSEIVLVRKVLMMGLVELHRQVLKSVCGFLELQLRWMDRHCGKVNSIGIGGKESTHVEVFAVPLVPHGRVVSGPFTPFVDVAGLRGGPL
jgi:hypothetical protein